MMNWRVAIPCLTIAVASSILFAQQRTDPSPVAPVKMASESKVTGNAANGRALFQGKGGCTACHRVAGEGSPLGPNLTQIASVRTVEELQKALLDPNPAVEARNQQYKIVTRDGKIVIGKLLNQDLYTLQMVDGQGNLLDFQKLNLRESGFVQTAPMPSYRARFAAGEQIDMVAYLASLKGIQPAVKELGKL